MIKDWRGVEIKVGDTVVYPGRHSSSLWMVEAVVKELVPGKPDSENYFDRVPHGLKVERRRQSQSWKGEVAHKVVPVQADRVTVVGR